MKRTLIELVSEVRKHLKDDDETVIILFKKGKRATQKLTVTNTYVKAIYTVNKE